MKGLNAKKIAGTALLAAFALIAFLIESLLPPLFLPGAKIGLANFFVFLALILYGGGAAAGVAAAKCLLGAVFGGNISSLMYSRDRGGFGGSSQPRAEPRVLPGYKHARSARISALSRPHRRVFRGGGGICRVSRG